MHRCSILPVITANKDTNYNHLVSQFLNFCCKHRLAQKVAAMYYTCTKHSNSTQCDADIANNCQWTDSINDGMCISNPNSVWEELLVCPGSVVSRVLDVERKKHGPSGEPVTGRVPCSALQHSVQRRALPHTELLQYTITNCCMPNVSSRDGASRHSCRSM
jgi:hypothetical protein